MELTIEHLAAYLPYKLKVLHLDKLKVMNCGQGSSGHWVGIGSILKWYGHHAKPIIQIPLRPLSDLTREIEVDGDRFVVADKLQDKEVAYYASANGDIVNWRWSDMKLLLSLHFDVFGVIPQNLAIDLNSIK